MTSPAEGDWHIEAPIDERAAIREAENILGCTCHKVGHCPLHQSLTVCALPFSVASHLAEERPKAGHMTGRGYVRGRRHRYIGPYAAA